MWLVMLPEDAGAAGGVEAGVKAVAPVGPVQHRATVRGAAYAAQKGHFIRIVTVTRNAARSQPFCTLLERVQTVPFTVTDAPAAVATSSQNWWWNFQPHACRNKTQLPCAPYWLIAP